MTTGQLESKGGAESEKGREGARRWEALNVTPGGLSKGSRSGKGEAGHFR